jgi:hypothetical protein
MIFQALARQDHGQHFRSGGCFSGKWFEVELLFLDFLRQFDAANRYGRRLYVRRLEDQARQGVIVGTLKTRHRRNLHLKSQF